jgi:hypothetical protein
MECRWRAIITTITVTGITITITTTTGSGAGTTIITATTITTITIITTERGVPRGSSAAQRVMRQADQRATGFGRQLPKLSLDRLPS